MTDTKKNKKSLFMRFLSKVEKIGNKFPPPMMIFGILCIAIIIISGIGAKLGWSATGMILNKESGAIEEQTIKVVSLFSVKGLQYMISNFTKNMMSYTSLGMMLTIMFGIGIAEHSGWLSGLIKQAVEITPLALVTPMTVFIGVMSNLAENAGYVLFVPLAAMIFKAAGKHPIAGIAAGFAGVSGGFAANLLISSNDAVLSGFTDTAIKLVNPNYNVNAMSNYFFMAASVALLVVLGTIVTEKIVIPMLGPYNEANAGDEVRNMQHILSDDERKALKVSNLVFILMIAGLIVSAIPQSSWLRNPKTGSLIEGSILLDGIVPILTLLFMVPGLIYGFKTKKYTTSRDVFLGFSSSIKTISGFICTVFMAAQFTKYFKYTNIGNIISINGANWLKAMNIGVIPLLIIFIFITGFTNLFMCSASAKYAIFAPVFVPMLFALGISPELTQAAYRIGDSSTNIIAPVLSSLPVILAAMNKYDKNSGYGTLLSCMMPYSFVFFIFWTAFLILFLALGLPLGPGVSAILAH